PVRPVLDAQRSGRHGRREDVQVAGQRGVHSGDAEPGPPQELRYYLVAPHYRSTIEYSREALDEAVRAYRRIEGFVRQVAQRYGVISPSEPGAEFAAAMDDDLGTPAALALVHNEVRQGNIALDSGDEDAARTAASVVRAQTDILGLDPLSPKWSTS